MIVSRAEAERRLGKKLASLGRGKRSYYLLTADGTRNLGGPYTRKKASKRLGQIEYFKRHNPSRVQEIEAAVIASPLDEAAIAAILSNPPLYIHPNQAARKIAAKALERRRKLPKSKRGGLDPMEAHEEGVGSGVLRARDIASGKRINAYQVKAFFDRHRSNYLKARADGKRWEDSKVWQAWDLWGGEPLRKQVEAAVRKDKEKRKGNPRLSAGMSPKDFDPIALRMGTKVEMEHTDDPKEARRIAQDHLVEDPEYYLKLLAIEGKPGPYKLVRSESNPKPFERRPHDWDEVLIDKGKKKLTRKQILDYYKKNAKKVWPYLEGQTVMVILAVKKNEFVRRRHAPDGAFIKLTKLKGIDDPKSFEYWINRRVVEFHPTLTTKSTPIVWLDLDMHTTKSAQARKKLLAKMRRAIPKLKKVFREMGVKKTYVYTSGTDGGFHLEGDLDSRKDVDKLRRAFTKRLAEVFADDPAFTTGIARSGQVRLDTTTLHKLGSLRAPYSMTVHGAPKRPIR